MIYTANMEVPCPLAFFSQALFNVHGSASTVTPTPILTEEAFGSLHWLRAVMPKTGQSSQTVGQFHNIPHGKYLSF